MDYDSMTPDELAAAARQGDQRAFEMLAEQSYLPLALLLLNSWLARSMDHAIALAWQALFNFWRYRANYDPTSPVRPYLRKIAKRVGLDAARRAGRDRFVPLEGDYSALGSVWPGARLIAEEVRRTILSCIQEDLEEQEREVILLLYYEEQDLNQSDVAAWLAISPATVTRVHDLAKWKLYFGLQRRGVDRSSLPD